MTNISQTIGTARVARPAITQAPHLATRQFVEVRQPDAVTRAASAQTFFTIRWLVDPERREHAFQAYAYFRWLDDTLDSLETSPQARRSMLVHQADLIDRAYQGERPEAHCAQERWMLDLIASEPERSTSLEQYVRRLMAVMAFDTERLGRRITGEELAHYSQDLAVGVTEAMHYFIGHDRPAPRRADRYQAVLGAHITHMLRDMIDDVRMGYYNMPREYLEANKLAVDAFASPPYRAWVRERVQLARNCFAAGSHYLAAVPCRRCRFAGFAYMRRFVHVLDVIEADGYILREKYADRSSLSASLALAARALQMAILSPTSATQA